MIEVRKHIYSFTVDPTDLIAEPDELNTRQSKEFTILPAMAGAGGMKLTGSSNNIFAKAIELLKQGILNASAFFAQIFRTPSIQKSTCDPTLPASDPRSCPYQYPYLKITVIPTPIVPPGIDHSGLTPTP